MTATTLQPSRTPPIAARRHPVVAEVDRQLVSSCGLAADASLAVAVSGGPDSIALLAAAVIRAQRRPPWPAPFAVHVHHHLRPSADDDARHVEHVCRTLGVELDVEHVRPAATRGGLGSDARAKRYDALQRSARRRGAEAVAVAHHAEDQLETVLMGICRGGGVDAAAGMPWSRPIDDGSPAVALVRPMLALRKRDCIALCEAAALTWRDDPTNADRSRPRGRLRADVLPALEGLWPRAAERAGDVAGAARAASALQATAVEAVFGPPCTRAWDRDALRQLPDAAIATGLRRAIASRHGDAPPPAMHLLAHAARAVTDATRTPRTFQLNGRTTLRVSPNRVELIPDPRQE